MIADVCAEMPPTVAAEVIASANSCGDGQAVCAPIQVHDLVVARVNVVSEEKIDDSMDVERAGTLE